MENKVGMLLPDVVIKNTLEAIVSLLREDIVKNSANEKQTILYRLLGVDEQGEALRMNLYDYFVQAKKMVTSPANLSVNFGYNQEVANIISLHILLPSEQGQSAIGMDEGYMESYEVDDNGEITHKQEYFTQVYDSVYQIMITSSNSSEVNVVYNILKSMLLMVTPHLELMGLRTPSLSGNDIVMRDDLTPAHIFHKVLNLSFRYEHNVPQILITDVRKKFHYTMRAVDGD